MSMNKWLADAYGTGASGEDLEKIAQAEMAQQLAQEEGIDLSGLSEEQIAALGQEVLGQQGAQQPGQEDLQGADQGQGQDLGIDPSQITPEMLEQAQAIIAAASQVQQGAPQQQGLPPQGAPQPEMQKMAEAQAKFDEADFLGRVMAHAFVQENEKIAGAMQHAGRIAGGAAIGAGVNSLAGGANAYMNGSDVGKAMKRRAVSGAVLGGAAGHGFHRAGGAEGIGNSVRAFGDAVEKGMPKHASVIEKAAQEHAAQILQANGIDPSTVAAPALPTVTPTQPAAPAQQAAIGELVEKRAHQILNSLGYQVNR